MAQAILPLENGDFLTRAEFERRYEAMPHLKKAELIEGVVYITTRVRFRGHAEPHAHLVGWMGNYCAFTPGVHGGNNASVRLDLDNEFQPDVLLIRDPAKGGKVRISPDDFIVGAPELVGEVCSSTVSIDLNAKMRVYRRNGVQEYLVWRVAEKAIDWFVLKGSEFRRLEASADGILKSKVFPGLWLDAAALISDDAAQVLRVVQQGVASAEHAAFVRELQAQEIGKNDEPIVKYGRSPGF